MVATRPTAVLRTASAFDEEIAEGSGVHSPCRWSPPRDRRRDRVFLLQFSWYGSGVPGLLENEPQPHARGCAPHMQALVSSVFIQRVFADSHEARLAFFSSQNLSSIYLRCCCGDGQLFSVLYMRSPWSLSSKFSFSLLRERREGPSLEQRTKETPRRLAGGFTFTPFVREFHLFQSIGALASSFSSRIRLKAVPVRSTPILLPRSAETRRACPPSPPIELLLQTDSPG